MRRETPGLAAAAPAIARRSILPRCLLLVALLCASGCSLLSVNLKSPASQCNLVGAVPSAGEGSDGQGSDIHCSVDEALRYTAGWRNQHLKAAGQHSVARNLNALVAFPAGAVGAFYGISGHGSKDRITRLALGSAMVYGTTSFLAPQGKQRVYLEGALALSCVMDATLNLRRSGSELSALTTQIAQVQTDEIALALVMSQHKSALADDSPTLARASVASGNALNLLVRAREIHRANDNAGLRAAFATERIVTQTAILASRQESDLNSLMAIASNLRGTAGAFGLSNLPAPAAAGSNTITLKAADSPQAIAENAIEKAINALVASTAKLLVTVRALELPVDAKDAYVLCNPDDIASDFAVLPADAAQSVKVGATLDFQITNTQSNAFPSHTVSGGKAGAVTVDGPLVKNGKLTITVTGGQATGGEPVTLTITDPTGKVSKTYKIAVLPADAAPAAGAASPAPSPAPAATKAVPALSGPPAGFAGSYSAADIEQLQCHLGLVGQQSDGVLGGTTYSALATFARSQQIPLGSTLTQKLFDAVLQQPDHCAGGE